MIFDLQNSRRQLTQTTGYELENAPFVAPELRKKRGSTTETIS
jgi:hypothetical protein